MNNYFSWTLGNIEITPNKSFEYQFEFGKNANFNLFEFAFRWTSKQDHAGPSFTFGIKYFFWININVYDHRHWNHEQNRWALPGDVKENG